MGVKLLIMCTIKNIKGFSLLELAIVLTIVAIIVSISVPGLNSQLSTQEIANTKQRLETISKSLETYRTLYGKYPCPSLPNLAANDSNYGVATSNCYSACPASLSCVTNPVNASLMSMAQGSVPFKTLGLPEAISIDGYKSKFTYAVDARFTQDENNCEVNGELIVSDYNNNTISNKAAFVLVSHGSDQKGARTPESGVITNVCDASAKDGANCDNNTTFRASEITKSNTSTSYYDDLITYNTNSKFTSCPAGLTNCQVWLDAADKCSITTNTGGVHRLMDKSPSGLHAVQNDSFYRPDYPGPKKNGISTIQFLPGTIDSLYVTGASGITEGPYTLVTVFATQTVNYSTNFNVITDSPSYAWVANDRSHGLVGTDFRSYNWTPGSIYYNNGGLGFKDYKAHVAISTVGTISNTLLYIDGLQVGSFAGTQSDFNWKNTIIIGSFPDNGPSDYDFLEYLYINKELTTAERKSLEQYLSKKWGILLN